MVALHYALVRCPIKELHICTFRKHRQQRWGNGKAELELHSQVGVSGLDIDRS
jgi:hypothetical protein